MDSAATVTVDPLLPASVTITATPPGRVCAGTAVTYTAVGVNGGTGPLYSWKVGGVSVTAGMDHYTYVPAAGDNIGINMLSDARCPSPLKSFGAVTADVADSSAVGLAIAADPGIAVPAGRPITFTATTALPVVSYQWKVNGTAIAGATDNTYTETNPADHELVSCEAMNNEECGGMNTRSVELSVSGTKVSPSFDKGSRQAEVWLYPNPAKNELIVTSPDLYEGAEVWIYNLWGQQVASAITTGEHEVIINVANLPGGMYTIRVADPLTGMVVTRKFVKE